jgi:hypothetical protein
MWSAWLSADGPQVSRKRQPVLDRAVGEAEELHGVDADDARGLDLLTLPHPSALVGLHAVDPGLAAGHHDVDDLLALARPPRHGGRRAELHVVGVGDDRHRLAPVLGQRLVLRLVGHAGSSVLKGSLRRACHRTPVGARTVSSRVP